MDVEYVKQKMYLTWYFFFHFVKALFFVFLHTIISKHWLSSIFVFHPAVHIIKLWEMKVVDTEPVPHLSYPLKVCSSCDSVSYTHLTLPTICSV